MNTPNTDPWIFFAIAAVIGAVVYLALKKDCPCADQDAAAAAAAKPTPVDISTAMTFGNIGSKLNATLI